MFLEVVQLKNHFTVFFTSEKNLLGIVGIVTVQLINILLYQLKPLNNGAFRMAVQLVQQKYINTVFSLVELLRWDIKIFSE